MLRKSVESVLQHSKRAVFVGPDTRSNIHKQFNRNFRGNEKRARNDLRLLATNFLANNKADSYNELVANLLSSFHKLAGFRL
jgi:hypothetical protein